MKCENCGNTFPTKIKADGRQVRLVGRKFCPDCSPVGGKNRRSYVIKLDDGEGHCARCGIKPLTAFHLRKNGLPLSYCKSCQDSVKVLKFKEKLEKLIVLKGGCCQDCGGIFPDTVYEFYNNRPFQTSKIKHMSIQKALTLLKDHTLLCLNCGAIRNWIMNQSG